MTNLYRKASTITLKAGPICVIIRGLLLISVIRLQKRVIKPLISTGACIYVNFHATRRK